MATIIENRYTNLRKVSATLSAEWLPGLISDNGFNSSRPVEGEVPEITVGDNNSPRIRDVENANRLKQSRRSAPFPIQRRPLLTSLVLEDISQSPISRRSRSMRSQTTFNSINTSPDELFVSGAHSTNSLNDTNVFDDDSSGSMFEEHFEGEGDGSSFLGETHRTEYDVTSYDVMRGASVYHHNATGHHHSDLFDMTFPDYVLNSPGPHRQQHPQNRSFTMGLNPPESPPPPEGQDRLHPHSPHHDRTYHFMRENLGRRSFPLDRASHVIVQNEQTKDQNNYPDSKPLQNVSAVSKVAIMPTTLTCLAIWDHVTFDPNELQFKCGDLIEILDNSDRHWWRGKLHDQEGWFPNAFVHETCNDLDNANKNSKNADVFKILHRRALAIRELLYTERFYVSTLKTVLEIYQSAMRKSRYIKSADVDTIFGNLPDIYHFHLLILSNLENCAVDKFRLETRFQDWCVSGVFLQNIGEFVRVYTIYCNNYQRAVSTLNYLENKKSVSSLLQKCRKKHGQVLSLQHFLLTPIQKICRYQMQLTELLKNTTEQHPDYLSLKKAAEEMRRAAFDINEKRRSSELSVLSSQSKTLTLGSLSLTRHSSDSQSPMTPDDPMEEAVASSSRIDEETATRTTRRKTSATKRIFRLFSQPLF